MPNYRRPFAPGGTLFFTLVTQDRRPILQSDLARPILRDAFEQTRHERPFQLIAMVLFGEHLHLMMELPHGESDFSIRLAAIKARFIRGFLAAGGNEGAVTPDRNSHGGRGVWQARFYDHLIRDETDFNNHLDYLHYNPVKHGYARCPHEYPHSTFSKWLRRGVYERAWGCACEGRLPAFDFAWADGRRME